MKSGYKEDLAYVHDVGFGDYARSAAPVLLRTLLRAGIRGGLIVDLGCGSGILAQTLISAGYDVLGVDLSPAMLELAHRKAPGAKFVRGSLLKTKLPACEAVISIGECLNYTFDHNDDAALARFFARVFKALRPGGVLIFDIAEPGQIGPGMPARRWLEGPDWAILLERTENGKKRTFTRRMVIFRKIGGGMYRRSEELHRIRLLRRAGIRDELARAGFKVRLLRNWHSPLAHGHAAFVAVKPKRGR